MGGVEGWQVFKVTKEKKRERKRVEGGGERHIYLSIEDQERLER